MRSEILSRRLELTARLAGSIKNNAFGPKEAIGYIAMNMDDPR